MHGADHDQLHGRDLDVEEDGRALARVLDAAPLLPAARAALGELRAGASGIGRRASRPRVTRRLAAPARRVSVDAGSQRRRAGALGVQRVRGGSRSIAARRARRSRDLLDIDLDAAAAGEPGPPGGLVRDAEFEHARLAVVDRVGRLRQHVALDAAARDRAEEVALVVDDEMAADGPGRRAPGLDHGRERDAAALAPPGLGLLQDVAVGGEHDGALRMNIGSQRPGRECEALIRPAART